MNFLVDAQLPPGLCRWLIERGYEAEHVTTASLSIAEDVEIWNHALKIAAIIITKDEDFAERTHRTSTGPTIIWLRIGNATNTALIDWLEPRWPSIEELLNSNNRLIEVR